MITNKIRLIELFGGVGCQSIALRDLAIANGLNPDDVFEHYKLVEFDKFPVKSYNAIHGTDFVPMDIQEIHGEDIDVEEPDKYTAIWTYSFPCQDLSVAGKQAGMDRDSGTRSGLLWQVERLLNEVHNLPNILIMENVTQVHSKKNLHNFEEWCQFLESKGYYNYWQDLEASEYGVPQHRNRCFMVSTLEEINFEFPQPIPLHEVMKDRLDPVVDEKFYINNEKADALIQQLIADGKLDEETILEAVDLSVNNPDTLDIANCVSARTDRGISNRRSEGSGVVQC